MLIDLGTMLEDTGLEPGINLINIENNQIKTNLEWCMEILSATYYENRDSADPISDEETLNEYFDQDRKELYCKLKIVESI